MKLGIDVLKECVVALNEVTQAACALTDGFQPFQDLKEILDLTKVLPPVIRDRSQVVPQFADLDDDEKKELVAFTESTIVLPPNCKTIEEWLEKGLALLYALSGFASLLVKPQTT